jgi:O-antigen/teichoic acid export membrane protein
MMEDTVGLPADTIEPTPPTTGRTVSRQRAGADILIQIVSRVGNLALGTVVTALLVRGLGSSQFGQWSTLVFVLTLVGFFATFGIEEIAVREAAREPGHEFDWLGSVLFVRLCTVLPVMLCSLVAVLLLKESHDMLVVGLVMLVGMPFGGFSTSALIFRLRVDNRVPMIAVTLRSVLWGAAVVVIYLEHGTMVAFALCFVATNAIGEGFLIAAARLKIGKVVRPNRKHVRRLVRDAAPIGISIVLITAYARIDQVIVFAIKGSTAAGLYGSVNMLLDSAHFVPGSILTTMAPVLAASWPRDPDRFNRASRMTLELLAIGSFGALAFGTVAAGPIVRLIFGAQFADAAKVVAPLGGAFVLMSFGYLVDTLMVTFGKQQRRVRIALVALVVNVLGNLALVPALGYVAAAWITFATEAVVIGMSSRIVLGELGVRRLSIGRVGRTAACALILAGVLLIARALSAPLAVLVALACVTYPALLLALRGIAVDDVLTVLRRRAAA